METKRIILGDLEFDISINRDIVKQLFERIPELEKFIKLQSTDNLSMQEMLELNDMMYETMEQATEIMLPQMLRLANTELFGNKSYDDYAKAIISYAKSYDVFYPYLEEVENLNDKNIMVDTDENGNEIYVKQKQGFALGLFEYAMSVFQQSKPKKARIRLVM